MNSSGFYVELDGLYEQGLSEASFGFLESVEVGDYYNLYDFLHGHCDEFAAALSDYYGYSIEYILDTANVLVHAYCTADVDGVKAYIDARGITTDSVRFFDEFADFCTYEKESGRFYDLKGECQLLRHNNTSEMYGDDSRLPNQDKDLVEFFKDNNSYYDIEVFEREMDMNSSKDNSVKYILTARSMWSKNVSERSSFLDETYDSLEDAKDKCREFQRGLASHMIAGIEEVRTEPGANHAKTGFYWELRMGQFEKTPDVKALRDWPAGQSITQYLKVGDIVDNAMYEHFLNILPPRCHSGGLLQVGESCDFVPDEDGKLRNTYLTFVRDNNSDCWVFKGECFTREWINRNPELEPQLDIDASKDMSFYGVVFNGEGYCEYKIFAKTVSKAFEELKSLAQKEYPWCDYFEDLILLNEHGAVLTFESKYQWAPGRLEEFVNELNKRRSFELESQKSGLDEQISSSASRVEVVHDTQNNNFEQER